MAHCVWGQWITIEHSGSWAVVDLTCGGLFIECLLISYCWLHIWFTVWGLSEILQYVVGGWVVVGPIHGRCQVNVC